MNWTRLTVNVQQNSLCPQPEAGVTDSHTH